MAEVRRTEKLWTKRQEGCRAAGVDVGGGLTKVKGFCIPHCVLSPLCVLLLATVKKYLFY